MPNEWQSCLIISSLLFVSFVPSCLSTISNKYDGNIIKIRFILLKIYCSVSTSLTRNISKLQKQ
jgi:hypothetical protein